MKQIAEMMPSVYSTALDSRPELLCKLSEPILAIRITLTFETPEQKQPLRQEAESKTLNRSAQTLLNALKGQGTLSISVAPKNQTFSSLTTCRSDKERGLFWFPPVLVL